MGDVLPPGTRLGRYEIVQRLALGGMAEIYLARMSGLAGFAKHVVLKRILPSHARDAEFVRMFFNEARYAATLDHPNIAHVYDLGEEQGLHYFTMEYLHGEDCRTLLRELSGRKLKLPLAHALTIVAAAATGCHFAHELTDEHGKTLGLVHRDVSPSNVVVTYTGAVKLVDFGIAKATALEDVTAIGVTKGKLAYMAPEQCRGEPLDCRVDIYALGVLLYELTTQRRAFYGANDAAVMWQVVTGGARPPTEADPDYPKALEAIIHRAMSVDRDQRQATARELQQQIEAFAREAGLSLSSSALGEYLEQTFGPKVEPWRAGEGRLAEGSQPRNSSRAVTPPPSTPFHGAAAPERLPGETTAAATDDDTGATTKATPIRSAAAASSLAARAGVEVAPAPVVVAARPSRWPWIAAAVIVAASAAVAIVIALPKLRRDREPAGDVVLVTEHGSASVEHDRDGGDPGAGAAVDAAAAPAGAIDAATGTGPTIDAGVKPHPPPSDPLGSAFRRQAAVGACFSKYGDGGVQSGITLRFVIDTGGMPTTVELFPAALATTPLGDCLLAAGRRVHFPAQDQPIAFRIPVTVHVTGEQP